MRTCGHVATYNAGCRCPACRRASADVRTRNRVRYRRRFPDGTPPATDLTWMDHAACRTQPTDVFFPTTTAGYKAAQALCAGCDVQSTCLAWAVATDQPYGVWGGLSFDERERLRGTV